MEFVHADEAGPEGVRLNDVGAGRQVFAVNVGDIARPSQAENVAKPAQVFGMVVKPLVVRMTPTNA